MCVFKISDVQNTFNHYFNCDIGFVFLLKERQICIEFGVNWGEFSLKDL